MKALKKRAAPKGLMAVQVILALWALYIAIDDLRSKNRRGLK